MADAHDKVEPLDSDLMNPVIAMRLGAAFAGLAVLLGAFGAHYLKGQVTEGHLEPKMLEAFQTGVQYQFYHALAIVMVAGSGGLMWQRHWTRWAVLTWSLGIILFSGSLYAMTLTGFTWLGAFTPFGGVAFIFGWILAGAGAKIYLHAPTDIRAR